MTRFSLLALVIVGLCGGVAPLHAEEPRAKAPSPLRLMPAEVDVVLHVPDPARVVKVATSFELLDRIFQLAPVKEQLDSTSFRRFLQLVTYFEKSLGKKWPDLVDQLAGGGIAVGTKIGQGEQPVALIVQGKNERLLEAFVKQVAELIESELVRQESKETLKKGDYQGIPAFRVGNLFVARAGTTLIVCNRKEAMTRCLNLQLGKTDRSILNQKMQAEVTTLLPKSPLVRAWINMAPVQASPQGKELYKTPRDNFILTVLMGGYLDLLGRSPFVCAGLYDTPKGYQFTIRMPRGVEGMGSDRLLHAPTPGKPGGRPLLTPRGTLYSSSFYYDLASIWKDREKLFPKAQADGLTQADKNSARTLAGIKLSSLFESIGAHHRLVVVHQPETGYKRQPLVRLPAVAFLPEMRQPDRFARAMDTLLRTGALVASQTFKLKLDESKHRNVDIVAYRFDERTEVSQDAGDIRYNYTPCYARIGDQFVFCSNVELCREIIDLMLAEQKSPGKLHDARAVERYDARGLSDFLRGIVDQLITQTILDQAVPPADARKQVDELLAILRQFGVASARSQFDARQFRYDLHLHLGK